MSEAEVEPQPPILHKISCHVSLRGRNAPVAIRSSRSLRKGVTDSHVASLLGMTFGAIAITAMPFEQCSAFAFSPPCGSCSVFEVARSVNKYALKEYPFGCGCPTLVIPRERGDRGNLAVRRTHQADNFAVIYIISFPGDVSTSLNMTIGCGCPTLLSFRGNEVTVGIQPSGAFRSARLPHRNPRCSSQ